MSATAGRWERAEGAPLPQGVHWVAGERAYNFSVYSKHAETVTLLLYAPSDLVNPLLAYDLDPRRHKSGRLWHCRIPASEILGAAYYAYRVTGPKPAGRTEWHAFDGDKILLDPYARSIYFPPAFERGAAMRPGSNAGKAPLGVLRPEEAAVDWGDDPRPRHDSDLVVYELHVRGFTRHASSGVEATRRGTFLGVIEKIPHLLELGITAVELMPVFQFDPQEGNYWGYMPLSFFAPHSGYARRPAAQSEEFRALVQALHAAGIEVILDVVYNHSGEGGQAGPVYSFKGLDNSTYYLMTDDPGHPYADFSGTGNTLHTANSAVRKLILDSLRYWAEEMHVDGFRFDLASIFTRNHRGEVDLDQPGIFSEIASDPVLASVRLIAEPWDNGGSHLGRGFPGISWTQWNDHFRDDVRRFLRGDPGLVPALMLRLYGSDDLFPDDREHTFHPYQSLNYVTCHDGFTLRDLLSYERKRNWANGQANADGPLQDHCWNCGFEGDVNVPAEVRGLRIRQAKNFCCLLLLANGTPMLRAGDEFLHTQGGNSNPYNQDNETSWLDWGGLRDHAEVFRYFRLMIDFRKRHPSLCRSRFWRDDVRWHGPGPEVDFGPESRTLAFFLAGESEGDDDLYVMINAGAEEREFIIQEGAADDWTRVTDTGLATPEDFPDPGRQGRLSSPRYRVSAHAVVVLLRPRRIS